MAARAVLRQGEEPIRTTFVFWLEQTSGLIVGHEVVAPDELPGALERTLRQALERPLAGEPRTPTKLRVERAEQAAEIRESGAGEFPIRTGAWSPLLRPLRLLLFGDPRKALV